MERLVYYFIWFLVSPLIIVLSSFIQAISSVFTGILLSFYLFDNSIELYPWLYWTAIVSTLYYSLSPFLIHLEEYMRVNYLKE